MRRAPHSAWAWTFHALRCAHHPHQPLVHRLVPVQRETASGRVLGEAERLSVDDALHAITMGAARTLKLEQRVGSIEPGKLADFAVLEDDPRAVAPAALKDVKRRRAAAGERLHLLLHRRAAGRGPGRRGRAADRPDLLVIEASSVSDVRIAQVGMLDPALKLNAILVAVDVQDVDEQLCDPLVGDMVRRQIAGATALVLTKADQASAPMIGKARQRLAEIAPHTMVLTAQCGEIPLAVFLDAVPTPTAAPAAPAGCACG
ncbi:N-acetylglucosamine-6-phosphate deacetylase [Manis javanica]|nr:N-acetylglucosamine-6-phosphate deacetylase [Manis javanica]